jgi:hypothetical protein
MADGTMWGRIGWIVAVGLLLAACAVSDGRLGTFVADTANYQVLTCKQLAGKERELKGRLTELEDLMRRAATGTGGSVVNAIAYRPEHIATQGSLDAARKVQAEKNCAAETAGDAPASLPPPAGRKR